MTSVPVFPEPSCAVTVMAFAPDTSAIPVTLQLVVPAAVPEPPVAALTHVTDVTPTLSEAVPPRSTLEDDVAYVGEEVGEVIAHVGAAESYVTAIVSLPTFPAASRARTVMTLLPEASAMPRTLQLEVPIAVPDAPVAAFVHLTTVTPTSSEAVPPRSIGDEEAVYVAEEVG
jgi:hypothetical protein